MKSLIAIVIASTMAGLVLGTTLAYYDYHAFTELLEEEIKPEVEVSAPPIAVVPETVFEFGKMEYRATMHHDFSIRNEGSSPLEVNFGSSTCNCTAIKLGNRLANPGDEIIIAPGESSTVMIEWTAKSSTSPFRHGATFSTNDPQNSQIELSVEGEVVESTAIRPRELLFGSLSQGKTQKAELYLLSYLDQTVEVLNYEIFDNKLAEQMELKIEPLSKEQLPDPDASSGVKVVATYQAGKLLGPFSGSLNLETNIENAKHLSIPIMGQVQGDISIYGPGWIPKRGLLRMGTFKSLEGKKAKLNLVVRGEHAKTTEFEVDSVDPPELKATLGESREMGEQLLHVPLIVEVPPGTRSLVRLGEPASTDAEIVLRSTHPDSSEVRLRVHFAVGQ